MSSVEKLNFFPRFHGPKITLIDTGVDVYYPHLEKGCVLPKRGIFDQEKYDRYPPLVTEKERTVIESARILSIGTSVASNGLNLAVQVGLGCGKPGMLLAVDGADVGIKHLGRMALVDVLDLHKNKAQAVMQHLAQRYPFGNFFAVPGNINGEQLAGLIKIFEPDVVWEVCDSFAPGPNREPPMKLDSRIVVNKVTKGSVPVIGASDVELAAASIVIDQGKTLFGGAVASSQEYYRLLEKNPFKLITSMVGAKNVSKRMNKVVRQVLKGEIDSFPQTALASSLSGVFLVAASMRHVLGKPMATSAFIDVDGFLQPK